MANEQDQAARNAEAQRRAASSQDAGAVKAEADKRNRESLDRAREERANRPQGVGGKPTPTQAENDEFRLGLRGLDDKEDDGSGPDFGAQLDENRARFSEERRRKTR